MSIPTGTRSPSSLEVAPVIRDYGPSRAMAHLTAQAHANTHRLAAELLA